MKDRTDEEGFDPVADAPADDAGRRGMDGSRRGGKHGDPQARDMTEAVLDPENLAGAWRRVKVNKGAPGIDGMTVDDFCPRSTHAMPVSGFLLRKPAREKVGKPTAAFRVRAGGVAEDRRSHQGWHLPSRTRPTGVDPQTRWDEASPRDPDGTGSGDPAGRRASAGSAL
ncbi:hypothetical protein HAHE_08720 [Haloferula helveola]|uniref:RNA-directed DNA polymerase n=1 Tax=Haloferula helveola TaxID=490095 RepID=A0ABM7RBG8_9BACT|nr:hypothetical protein HAHE_08720 [Haloferula helveola]